MDQYGALSIIPPVIAIIIAIKFKQVIPALLTGLLIGFLIIQSFNPLQAFIATIDCIVDVFKSAGNTRTILFTLLIGALIRLVQLSGGIDEFISKITPGIEKSSNPRKKIQVLSSLMGFLIFIESNISILTVGTIFRPIFDKYKISRLRLAHLVDSSSAPACILIPFNAWGAYVIGLISAYEDVSPFQTLIFAIPLNFYAIITLLFVFYVSSKDVSFSTMKKLEITDDLEPENRTSFSENSKKSIWTMILPLGGMIASMLFFLAYTGYSQEIEGSFGERIWQYMNNASGSASVLYAVIIGVLIISIQVLYKKHLTPAQLMIEITEGMKEMVTMALLMLLAFALSTLCKTLGTGNYVADISQQWLSPNIAPAVIFLTSCFIAFSTGTSWGTFAIMLTIAIPMAQQMDINIYLATAAVLGGGVFGDHCSPISDTTLIASMAADVKHIDHVKTQLPYALICGSIAVGFYLIAGWIL